MLIKTVESLRKLSAAEEKQIPVDLSGPQLVGVLERLTLALKAPRQTTIEEEAAELVGVLERLTLALKAPEQRANGNGPRALPAKAGGDSGEHK